MAKEKVITADPSLYGPAAGRETPDPTPVAMPLGYSHPETTEQIVARLLRSEQLASLARQQGVETFEEFMDFGDESEDDPYTPHEEFWDPIFKRPTTLLELQELDRTLKGGGSIELSEEDNLALRRHLREVASAKAPVPPDASVAAPAAPVAASATSVPASPPPKV